MKKIFLLSFLMILAACSLPAAQVETAPTQISATLTPATTASPAPTRTPAPKATIAPTSVPLFFTEEFNADLSAWEFFQTGGAESPAQALQQDSLVIQMTSPNTWYYAIHQAHEYEKVFVSAKFSGAPSGSIGVVCNYSEENGWYEFNINHEGAYNVLFGQWLSEGIAQYRPILNASSEYLQAGNMNYEIGMTCADNILLFYINGKLFRKMDVAHIGLAQGKVGMTASSFDHVPMQAIFEWFKVSSPE